MNAPRSTTIQTADGPLYVRHGDGARIDYDHGAVEGSIEVAGQVQRIIYVAWNDGMNRARLVDGQRVRILRPVLIPGDRVRWSDKGRSATGDYMDHLGNMVSMFVDGVLRGGYPLDQCDRLPPEPTPPIEDRLTDDELRTLMTKVIKAIHPDWSDEAAAERAERSIAARAKNEAEPTPAPLPLREKIRHILAQNGVDSSDNSPHSWRCFDKVRYPEPCRHIDDLVDELAAAVEREGSGND